MFREMVFSSCACVLPMKQARIEISKVFFMVSFLFVGASYTFFRKTGSGDRGINSGKQESFVPVLSFIRVALDTGFKNN